jgi:hypothetical protein
LFVTPDDASPKVLTGEDDVATRGEDEPLFEDAIPLEPIPDVRPVDEG